MSDFRIFCIGGLMLCGILSFGGNWTGDAAVKGSAAAILAVLASLTLGGMVAVAIFGKRKSQ